MQSIIKNEFNAHLNSSQKTLENIGLNIEIAAKICVDCLKKGNKILIFGNGGSAADAQHIAAEIVGRYKVERKGLPAIALTTDTSVLTSIGNDFGFEHLFDRQVQALANKNDVLIGISTGGTSKNVISALKLGKSNGCKVIGFSGKSGGDFNNICDINLVVASEDTPRIQEIHILIGHIICHLIDQAFITSI
ncbi:D-sedoheptulose 7-phosphate isomerase [Candidatus Pseudothioglobus sp. Uisw_016]|jgi:D-sedoheptulose 7-phosphate isomerase|uniref:D-sedoheptulose 7-phosphate isomerase n=1 Tax=Candidatus Pseudothioglobus sp. Uisw_016 TaxID=3230995 RepID=UPI003A87D429